MVTKMTIPGLLIEVKGIHIMVHIQGGIVQVKAEIENKNKDCIFEGHYTGRDSIKNVYNNVNIVMLEDKERKFIVTHDVNTKPVSYFTGRETELQELRSLVETGQKSVLVSGMGGIGKTSICRKLFDEYESVGECGFFHHIGYIEYNRNMESSLQKCLFYKKQEKPEANKEAAWMELEYLAADGKLLLFIDNVNLTMREDEGLKRLKNIPGAVVLTSRRTYFSKEFKTYKIGFLDIKQCKAIYEKIRYEDSGREVPEDEIQDLEYIIDKLAAKHTITIEFLAHLAQTKHWTVKKLRDELEEKGFQLEYKDEEDELVNIQKSYETLYDLSKLTKAEQNILEAFSVFPYIPLAAETCNQWLLSDAGASEDDDILTGLYRKGWLQFNLEHENYSLHPVFAKFIYEKCKPGAEMHHGLIESCQKCLEISKNGSALEHQKFIPFAENIVRKLEMKNNIEKAEFIEAVARCFPTMANPQKAEEFYAMALEIYESIYGEEHYNTIRCIYGLAESNEFQDASRDKAKKAKELYERCLRLCKKVLGDEHSYTIKCYNILAFLYNNSKQMQLNYFLKVYRFCFIKLGQNNFYTCVAYENIEKIYYKWNQKGNFKQWLEEQMKE